MYTRKDLHQYQHRAVDFIHQKQKCALWLFMGAGKSVISLTAIADMISASIIKKALVIAPLRVARSVWKQEGAAWEHLQHLVIEVVTGSAEQRKTALNRSADVYVINRENVVWLIKECKGKWPYDAVIVDESSSFKSSRAKRFRALKKPIQRSGFVVLLSGTPAPNNLHDLWSQMYLIDQGAALGSTITRFRKQFCDLDYWGHTWTTKPALSQTIYDRIQSRVLSMKGEDYLELPDRIELIENIQLSDQNQKQYDHFEKTLFMEHGGSEIEALSAAVLANKLLQFCNGAIYTDEEHHWKEIHTQKLDRLAEVIEENQNENILIAYNYRHDLIRLQTRFPKAMTLDKNPATIDLWNQGKIKILLAHPASCGHGLNLQHGGSMLIFFSLNWNLEYDLQIIARLLRQGQTQPVRIIRIVCDNTIDQRVLKVLNNKNAVQQDLLNAVRQS
jgi:SNF2 family DNA or RNA helicase